MPAYRIMFHPLNPAFGYWPEGLVCADPHLGMNFVRRDNFALEDVAM